jgi:hypothetical protein
MVAHVGLILLQLLLVLLRRQIDWLKRGGKLRCRTIFPLCELLLFSVAMGGFLVFLALHLHQNLNLFSYVVNDCDAGKFAQLFTLKLEGLSFVQVDLNDLNWS